MQEENQGQNEITKDLRNNVQQVTQCTLDATFDLGKGRGTTLKL